MHHSLRISLYAFAIVLLVWAATIPFGSWYHDDACTIEEWKCDAGAIGFFFALWSTAAGAFGLIWVAAELIALARGAPRPRPSRTAEVVSALAGALLLFATPAVLLLIVHNLKN